MRIASLYPMGSSLRCPEGRHSVDLIKADRTFPGGSMTNETTAFPKNSLCSLCGSFGGTVEMGVRPSTHAGSCALEAHALSKMTEKMTTTLRIVLMAGLTPELSRPAPCESAQPRPRSGLGLNELLGCSVPRGFQTRNRRSARAA